MTSRDTFPNYSTGELRIICDWRDTIVEGSSDNGHDSHHVLMACTDALVEQLLEHSISHLTAEEFEKCNDPEFYDLFDDYYSTMMHIGWNSYLKLRISKGLDTSLMEGFDVIMLGNDDEIYTQSLSN